MSINDNLGFVLRMLFIHLANTPLYIALIVGIVIASRHRALYPSSARLALIGFGLALGGLLVFTTINAVLPFWLISAGLGPAQLGIYLAAGGFASVLVQTVAWGCVVAALSRAWQAGQEQRGPTYERGAE